MLKSIDKILPLLFPKDVYPSISLTNRSFLWPAFSTSVFRGIAQQTIGNGCLTVRGGGRPRSFDRLKAAHEEQKPGTTARLSHACLVNAFSICLAAVFQRYIFEVAARLSWHLRYYPPSSKLSSLLCTDAAVKAIGLYMHDMPFYHWLCLTSHPGIGLERRKTCLRVLQKSPPPIHPLPPDAAAQYRFAFHGTHSPSYDQACTVSSCASERIVHSGPPPKRYEDYMREQEPLGTPHVLMAFL